MNTQPSSSGILQYSHTFWWRRPQAHDRPPLHWHIASRAFALALWATPRPFRFRTIKTLARALTPLVARTSWYHRQRQLRINGASEIALHYALSILSHSGVMFDPVISVDGAEKLADARKRGKGVLVVAPHALLSLLLFRYLHDIGCVPTILSASPSVHIYGQRLVARALQPSPATMFSLRSALRSGGVVCAMIDQLPPEARRAIEVATAEGPIYISDALFRLAERCNASVIFTTVRLEKQRGLVLTFVAPEPAPHVGVETMTKGFATFLQSYLASIAR